MQLGREIRTRGEEAQVGSGLDLGHATFADGRPSISFARRVCKERAESSDVSLGCRLGLESESCEKSLRLNVKDAWQVDRSVRILGQGRYALVVATSGAKTYDIPSFRDRASKLENPFQTPSFSQPSALIMKTSLWSSATIVHPDLPFPQDIPVSYHARLTGLFRIHPLSETNPVLLKSHGISQTTQLSPYLITTMPSESFFVDAAIFDMVSSSAFFQP